MLNRSIALELLLQSIMWLKQRSAADASVSLPDAIASPI
jgi:hypothetical protein